MVGFGINSVPSKLIDAGADSKRSSPSLLARQLRLRLVADDDSDIPRNLHNIVVSIHAIATFQALHDYLRPRVSGLLSGGSRLSGMLAALAASGMGSASSRAAAEELLASAAAAGNSAPPVDAPAASSSASTGGVIRRRSQRLSAKKEKGGLSNAEVNSGAIIAPEGRPGNGVTADVAPLEAPASHTSGVAPSSTQGDTLVHDGGFGAEFSDDEVDAEVCVICEQRLYRFILILV